MDRRNSDLHSRPLREYTPVDLDLSSIDGLDVGCGDGRFQQAFFAHAKSREFNKPDIIRYPAPSKNISNGVLLPGISMLVQKHELGRINVKDHTFCGGFEDEYQGTDDESIMVEAHKPKLEAAAFLLLRKMPGVVVVTYVVGIEEVLYEKAWTHDELPAN